jgi:hypothetical protein
MVTALTGKGPHFQVFFPFLSFLSFLSFPLRGGSIAGAGNTGIGQMRGVFSNMWIKYHTKKTEPIVGSYLASKNMIVVIAKKISRHWLIEVRDHARNIACHHVHVSLVQVWTNVPMLGRPRLHLQLIYGFLDQINVVEMTLLKHSNL